MTLNDYFDGKTFLDEVEHLEFVYRMFGVKGRRAADDWDRIVKGEIIETKVNDRFYFQVSAKEFGALHVI